MLQNEIPTYNGWYVKQNSLHISGLSDTPSNMRVDVACCLGKREGNEGYEDSPIGGLTREENGACYISTSYEKRERERESIEYYSDLTPHSVL